MSIAARKMMTAVQAVSAMMLIVCIGNAVTTDAITLLTLLESFALGMAAATMPINIMALRGDDEDDEPERDTGA